MRRLTEIDLPNSVTSVGLNAFPGLTKVSFPTDNIRFRFIDGILYDLSAMAIIYVSEELPETVTILEGITENGALSDDARERVMRQLRNHFRPEFLNRIDDTVFFTPLTRQEVEKIAHLQLDRLRRRLADKQLGLRISTAAMDKLLSLGYDPVYGARPMKRIIQSRVETMVARALIRGDVLPGQTLLVDVQENEFTVSTVV